MRVGANMEVDRMRVPDHTRGPSSLARGRVSRHARAWLAFRTLTWGAVAGAIGGGWFGVALARHERTGLPGFAIGAALGIVAALIGHLVSTASRPGVRVPAPVSLRRAAACTARLQIVSGPNAICVRAAALELAAR